MSPRSRQGSTVSQGSRPATASDPAVPAAWSRPRGPCPPAAQCPAGPEPQRRHLGGEALTRCGQPQCERLTTAPDRQDQRVRSVPGITVEPEVPSPALLIDPLRQAVQPPAPVVRPAQHGPERGRNGNHEDESITPLQPLTRALCRSGAPNRRCRNQTAVSGVRPPRSARPRAVPVLARYHARLLAPARSAGTGLVCGGTDPGRRNITNPLITALDGGGGLGRGGAAARGHRRR
jgi:hypothetical protein